MLTYLLRISDDTGTVLDEYVFDAASCESALEQVKLAHATEIETGPTAELFELAYAPVFRWNRGAADA